MKLTKRDNTVMSWIGWLFGTAFNLILMIGILFIITDITGSRKSSNTKTEASSSVQNVR